MPEKGHQPGSHFAMERLGRVEELDRLFDIEYWQRQDPDARATAAWELVVFAHERKGASLLNSNFKELLSLFNEDHVKYLIVGGYAVIEYTQPR